MTLRSQLPTAEELRSLWRDSPRWRGIERPYSAEDVVRLRGTIAVEHRSRGSRPRSCGAT